VTFPAGVRYVEVKLTPEDDSDNEGDEWLIMRLEGSSGYVSAENAEAEVLIVAEPPETRVVITQSDKGEGPVVKDGLKVAKWHDAFFVDPADGKVKVRGPDENRLDFIDRDMDRFNVFVYDKAAWAAGKNHIEVRISTTNKEGFTAYDDLATVVDLVRDDKGKGEPWFWTDSQLLVSNQVDDKYESSEYLGLDEAPPIVPIPQPKHEYTWLASDRTHRIALGGTVKAVYIDGTAKSFEKEAAVKVKHTVKLNVHIMKDKAGGALAAQQPDVETYITKMREIYAQIGVAVQDSIYEQDPPDGLDLSDGVELGNEYPSAEAKLLLADKPLPHRTIASASVERPRIELYFVSNWHRIIDGQPTAPFSGTRGIAFTRDGAWDPKYADSVIIQMSKGTFAPPQVVPPYVVPAHEVGHILENIRSVDPGDNAHYPYIVPLPSPSNLLDTVNLMVQGPRAETSGAVDDEVTDARRLTLLQQDKMLNQRKNVLS
jgi:hypothetical protein